MKNRVRTAGIAAGALAVVAASAFAATSAGGASESAAPVASTAQTAGATSGGNAQAQATHYTHATTLRKKSCRVYHNYPKRGVPARFWTKPRTSHGNRTHLGVRYTYKGYSLVLDYARGGVDPAWGFVAKSCLTDPKAYSRGSEGGTPLPDLSAPGGNMQVKHVPINAPHAGKAKRQRIHVGSTGSLRSGPKSFVIGNVSKGDPFYITRKPCGHHGAKAWVLGYAPNSGRWGYVQATHLPACR
jgi:cytochrome c5